MIQTDLAIREFPEHPLLGRKLAVLDPASRQYAAVGALVGTDQPPRNKTWRTSSPRAYDQGRTSECTCYSGKRLINSVPLRKNVDADIRLPLDPTPVYNYAQTIDPWPGEDYDGTSVLAAAKAFKAKNLTNGYRWCFGFDDVLQVVSWYGPVSIGITWYQSMFDPNDKYFIPVNESSGVAGGHALVIQGINVDHEYAIMTNSWGTGWGDRGRAKLRFDDLKKLLGDWGEAVAYL